MQEMNVTFSQPPPRKKRIKREDENNGSSDEHEGEPLALLRAKAYLRDPKTEDLPQSLQEKLRKRKTKSRT